MTSITPFNFGEEVYYRPSWRAEGQLVMTDWHQLKRGAKYKVSDVLLDGGEWYVAIEGCETFVPHAVHWSLFSRE